MRARAECISICEKMNAPGKNITGGKRGNEATGIFSEMSFVCSARRCRMSIWIKNLLLVTQLICATETVSCALM